MLDVLRQVNIGRKATVKARLNISAARKRSGARPPKAGPAWSEAEDSLVRTLPPNEVAERTGRTLKAVYMRRFTLKSAWTKNEDRLARELPAQEAALKTGRTLAAVYQRRFRTKANFRS